MRIILLDLRNKYALCSGKINVIYIYTYTYIQICKHMQCCLRGKLRNPDLFEQYVIVKCTLYGLVLLAERTYIHLQLTILYSSRLRHVDVRIFKRVKSCWKRKRNYCLMAQHYSANRKYLLYLIPSLTILYFSCL